MNEFKNIKYEYNNRTTRYIIHTDKTEDIVDACIKMVGKSANYLFVKQSKTKFEIQEFFLLELHHILYKIKHNEHGLGINIGGIVLNNLLEFLSKHTWLANRKDIETNKLFDLNNIKRTMKFLPLEHQLTAFKKYESIKHIANLRGSIIDASPGSGKTYISLALTELLDYELIIIVAPKNTLFEVWQKSVSEQLFKRKQSNVVIGSEKKTYDNEKFIITHNEYLVKLMKDKKLARRIKRLKPALIVDEFHNFNEIMSDRTGSLLDFVNHMKFTDIILLTGTPIKMKLAELKPMLYILDKKFPKAKDNFDNFYRSLNGIKVDLIRERFNLYKERIENDRSKLPEIEILEYKQKLPNGSKFTVESISSRMTDYKHNRLLELEQNRDKYIKEYETLLELSLKNCINSKEFDLSTLRASFKTYRTNVNKVYKYSDKGQLYKIYDLLSTVNDFEKSTILKYLSGMDKKQFRHLASIIKYPKLKVLGEALGKILLGSRIECYTALAKEVNYGELLNLTNKKGLIFSNYISVCETAVESCKNQNFSPISVYGEYVDELTNSVKIFNNLDNDINPIVATYKSLSTGVPLTSANVVILIDSALRSYQLEQAISRSYRIGNNEKVDVFFVKLDTGHEFNITERDLFIVNTSEYNVELITGNKPIYDIPRQEVIDDNEEDEVIIEELEEEVEDILMSEFSNIHNFVGIDGIYSYVKDIMKKIKVI